MNSEPLTQKEKERVRAEFTWLPYKSWTDRTEDEKERTKCYRSKLKG